MKAKQGFTFIELVSAVSIMLLVSTGIVVSLNDFNAKEKSKAAVTEFTEQLKLARNYALTSQLPQNFPNNSTLAYVQFVISGGSMAIQAVDTTNGVYPYLQTIKKMEVGVGVTMTNSRNNSTTDFPLKVYFSLFKGSLMKYSTAEGKPVLTDTADRMRIQVNYQGGNVKDVYVNSAGQVTTM